MSGSRLKKKKSERQVCIYLILISDRLTNKHNMAGEPELTGLAKHFNSQTFTGRANVAKVIRDLCEACIYSLANFLGIANFSETCWLHFLAFNSQHAQSETWQNLKCFGHLMYLYRKNPKLLYEILTPLKTYE